MTAKDAETRYEGYRCKNPEKILNPKKQDTKKSRYFRKEVWEIAG